MSRPPVDTLTPALRARDLVRRELERRGWTVRELREGGVTYLAGRLPDGREARVRVKAKTSGSWQATTSSGRAAPEPPAVATFWAFVDLRPDPPRFYVAPDAWVRSDIEREHREYLDRHEGHRPRNDASTHHAIAVDRIAQWADRWRQLVAPRIVPRPARTARPAADAG